MSTPPTIGFCGPWSRDAARGTWAQRLADIKALNGRAVRLTTGGDGYGNPTATGYRPPPADILDGTARILADCRANGLKVLLQINSPSSEEKENSLTPEMMVQAAQAWRPVLQAYRDVLLAVEIDNEVNSSLRGLERTYDRATADARMEHRLSLLRAFAGEAGYVSNVPVTLGGMAGAEIEATGGVFAERLLRALAPDVHAGRIAAVADFHQYGRSLVPTCRAILQRAGWPSDTVLVVGETNVNARTTADVAAKLDALLTRLAFDGADYIFGYTLGSHEAYGILPGTAAGAVWARHAAGAPPPEPCYERRCRFSLFGWCIGGYETVEVPCP